MRTIYAIAIVIVSLKCANSQFVPRNPCPNLFQYFQENGIIYGRLEFPNDYSGYYELTVNMSVATILSNNENIRLELRTSPNELVAGRPVAYNIYFPIQNVIPRPTNIVFNRRLYCRGPQEEILPGRGVTNMWATTYFRVTITGRPTRPNSIFDEVEPVSVNTIPSVPINTPPPTTSTTKSTPTPFTSRPNPSGSFFLTIGSPPSGTLFPNNNSSGTSFLNTAFFNTIGVPALNNPFLPSNKPTNPTYQISVTSNVTASGNTVQTSVTSNVTPGGNTVQQCGSSSVNVQQLVVNGDFVKEGEFPWMVAIMYRQNLDYKYGCTGSLVTNRHVITAAHCVRYINAPLVPTEDLLLVFGKMSLRNWTDGGIIRDVQNVTTHPEYKQNKGDADIAVLTLQKPVDFETFIQPVCLWQEDDDLDNIVGQQGTVAGWGRDESGRNFVEDAKRINLPIVSQVTCLRSDSDFADITSSRTFCAGKLDGSGPCTGDSGAGFVMRRNGRWTVRGVVAVALKDTGTCSLTKYSVFADLAKFGSWVRNALV